MAGRKTDFEDVVTVQQPAQETFKALTVTTVGTSSEFALINVPLVRGGIDASILKCFNKFIMIVKNASNRQ